MKALERWAMPKYVTIEKMAEMTGLSIEAIRAYIKKGYLRLTVHWIKGANGRTMINVERFFEWLESTPG